jgi:hypothetical protein
MTTPDSFFIEPQGGQRGIYRVITAVETSTFAGSMPTYHNCREAFRVALPYGPDSTMGPDYFDWGRWIGPGPRVVRILPSPTGAYQTHATWVAFWPDTPRVREHFEWLHKRLLDSLTATLPAITGSKDWSRPTSMAYDPSVNGPIQWWMDGRAQATRTRDVADGPIGRITVPPENPLGPDALLPQPGSMTRNWIAGAAFATFVGGVLWVLAKEPAR